MPFSANDIQKYITGDDIRIPEEPTFGDILYSYLRICTKTFRTMGLSVTETSHIFPSKKTSFSNSDSEEVEDALKGLAEGFEKLQTHPSYDDMCHSLSIFLARHVFLPQTYPLLCNPEYYDYLSCRTKNTSPKNSYKGWEQTLCMLFAPKGIPQQQAEQANKVLNASMSRSAQNFLEPNIFNDVYSASDIKTKKNASRYLFKNITQKYILLKKIGVTPATIHNALMKYVTWQINVNTDCYLHVAQLLWNDREKIATNDRPLPLLFLWLLRYKRCAPHFVSMYTQYEQDCVAHGLTLQQARQAFTHDILSSDYASSYVQNIIEYYLTTPLFSFLSDTKAAKITDPDRKKLAQRLILDYNESYIRMLHIIQPVLSSMYDSFPLEKQTSIVNSLIKETWKCFLSHLFLIDSDTPDTHTMFKRYLNSFQSLIETEISLFWKNSMNTEKCWSVILSQIIHTYRRVCVARNPKHPEIPTTHIQKFVTSFLGKCPFLQYCLEYMFIPVFGDALMSPKTSAVISEGGKKITMRPTHPFFSSCSEIFFSSAFIFDDIVRTYTYFLNHKNKARRTPSFIPHALTTFGRYADTEHVFCEQTNEFISTIPMLLLDMHACIRKAEKEKISPLTSPGGCFYELFKSLACKHGVIPVVTALFQTDGSPAYVDSLSPKKFDWDNIWGTGWGGIDAFLDVIDRNIRIMETHTPQEREYAMARMKAMDALFCLCALIQRKQNKTINDTVTGTITFQELRKRFPTLFIPENLNAARPLDNMPYIFRILYLFSPEDKAFRKFIKEQMNAPVSKVSINLPTYIAGSIMGLTPPKTVINKKALSTPVPTSILTGLSKTWLVSQSVFDNYQAFSSFIQNIYDTNHPYSHMYTMYKPSLGDTLLLLSSNYKLRAGLNKAVQWWGRSFKEAMLNPQKNELAVVSDSPLSPAAISIQNTIPWEQICSLFTDDEKDKIYATLWHEYEKWQQKEYEKQKKDKNEDKSQASLTKTCKTYDITKDGLNTSLTLSGWGRINNYDNFITNFMRYGYCPATQEFWGKGMFPSSLATNIEEIKYYSPLHIMQRINLDAYPHGGEAYRKIKKSYTHFLRSSPYVWEIISNHNKAKIQTTDYQNCFQNVLKYRGENTLVNRKFIPGVDIYPKQYIIQTLNPKQSFPMWKYFLYQKIFIPDGACLTECFDASQRPLLFQVSDDLSVFAQNYIAAFYTMDQDVRKYPQWGNSPYDHLPGTYLCKSKYIPNIFQCTDTLFFVTQRWQQAALSPQIVSYLDSLDTTSLRAETKKLVLGLFLTPEFPGFLHAVAHHKTPYSRRVQQEFEHAFLSFPFPEKGNKTSMVCTFYPRRFALLIDPAQLKDTSRYTFPSSVETLKAKIEGKDTDTISADFNAIWWRNNEQYIDKKNPNEEIEETLPFMDIL